jgi:hypothetical protein
MLALGSGGAGVDETYALLRSAVAEHLPPGASLTHGEVVGFELARALYPIEMRPRPSVGSAQVSYGSDYAAKATAALAAWWQKACSEPPSPLAADRGVWSLNAELLLADMAPAMHVAFETLFEAKLRALFPPPA